MVRVKKVEYIEAYKLKLRFSDGKMKVVDLKKMLDGAENLFAALLDPDYFAKVECDGFSIVWPNGVDICPDLLYKMGRSVRTQRKKSAVGTRRKRATKKT